jgi:hypothetical protein
VLQVLHVESALNVNLLNNGGYAFRLAIVWNETAHATMTEDSAVHGTYATR